MKKTDLLEKKVFSYCEANRMLSAGDCVVVGVSGGADSVCLLFLLCAFRKRLSLSLKVVHVNHGIRPDAQRDADYVKALCDKLDLPFTQVNANVREIADNRGISEEEAGREVRYRAFSECAAAFLREKSECGDPTRELRMHNNPAAEGSLAAGNVKIALAHHMGDRAETLLFHLFRGSGLKGAGSIAPVRRTKEGFQIIRPLLCLMREEIEDYLSEKGVAFCQDSTNAGDEYARNRIRHHILPYAQEEICQGAVRHLNEFAELAGDTERYLQAQTDLLRNACAEYAADGADTVCRIRIAPFLQADPLLQKRLLLELLMEISPGRKDIGALHVKAVLDLFTGESGRSRALPFKIVARREYDHVILDRKVLSHKNARSEASPDKIAPGEPTEVLLSSLSETGRIEINYGRYSFLFEELSHEKNGVIPENTYTKWFDYDKIKDTLYIRTRKTGDYLTIRGAGGKPIRKTVKDYMITEKIPRDLREELPLLAQGEEILWIPGYRISESYKVNEGTRRILRITYRLSQE